MTKYYVGIKGSILIYPDDCNILKRVVRDPYQHTDFLSKATSFCGVNELAFLTAFNQKYGLNILARTETRVFIHPEIGDYVYFIFGVKVPPIKYGRSDYTQEELEKVRFKLFITKIE